MRSRCISRYLCDLRGKLNDGAAIETKKLAMNKPAANVRKNGRTLFNTPLYNMQFHLLKASINVYGGFSKTVSKIGPNS